MDTLGYPCVLCAEVFFDKATYELHISDCVQETSNSMTAISQEAATAQEKFIAEGELKYKLQAELCQNKFQSMKYRLNLLGYKRCANGSISPQYSKFFSTVNCGYCGDGFSELTGVLEHKDLCLKTAMDLKISLHQTIKTLERDLQSSPHNPVIKQELKAMKQCFTLISFKLFVNDAIELDAFNL